MLLSTCSLGFRDLQEVFSSLSKARISGSVAVSSAGIALAVEPGFCDLANWGKQKKIMGRSHADIVDSPILLHPIDSQIALFRVIGGPFLKIGPAIPPVFELGALVESTSPRYPAQSIRRGIWLDNASGN